jgi:hypothetical protein
MLAGAGMAVKCLSESKIHLTGNIPVNFVERLRFFE